MPAIPNLNATRETATATMRVGLQEYLATRLQGADVIRAEEISENRNLLRPQGRPLVILDDYTLDSRIIPEDKVVELSMATTILVMVDAANGGLADPGQADSGTLISDALDAALEGSGRRDLESVGLEVVGEVAPRRVTIRPGTAPVLDMRVATHGITIMATVPR